MNTIILFTIFLVGIVPFDMATWVGMHVTACIQQEGFLLIAHAGNTTTLQCFKNAQRDTVPQPKEQESSL